MDGLDVIRLLLGLAIQADIEGMKAFNSEREHSGYSVGWNESHFYEKAEELRKLAKMSPSELLNYK